MTTRRAYLIIVLSLAAKLAAFVTINIIDPSRMYTTDADSNEQPARALAWTGQFRAAPVMPLIALFAGAGMLPLAAGRPRR
jgi:hypothetical protein